MIYSIKSIAMSINKSGGYSDYNKNSSKPKNNENPRSEGVYKYGKRRGRRGRRNLDQRNILGDLWKRRKTN